MQNRRIAAAALGGATLAAVVAGTATAATAAPAVRSATVPCTVGYPPVATQCTVSAALTVDPNGNLHLSFTFTAVGKPGETFTIFIFSTPINAGTVKANAAGDVVGSVTIPAGELAPGTHTIQAVGSLGDTASTTFVVPGAVAPAPTTTTTGSLPFTGADVAAISIIGGALVVGGGVAFAAGARRKRSAPVA